MLRDMKAVASYVDYEFELILGLELQLNANSVSQDKVSSIPQLHLYIESLMPSHRTSELQVHS